MKFRELSNELSMSVRDPVTKLDSWLRRYLHGDFKAHPPPFRRGMQKYNELEDTHLLSHYQSFTYPSLADYNTM